MRKQSMVNGQQLIVSALCSGIRSLTSVFLLIIFNLSLTTVSAQSVSASLDRDKILLGEQVTLQLNLTGVNPLILFITSWPQLKDTLNHIEILKRTPLDTIEVNGTNSFQQNFIITGFDSGRWQLGPFDFMLQDKASGKQIKISSPAVYLTVLPVDVTSMKDYHPLKEIIEVQTSFNWLPVIIIAAVILIVIISVIIIKKRKKKIVNAPKNVLPGTPLQRAVQKLRQLQSELLNNDADIKKFHSDIDIITRQYFEEISHIQAMQATTSELFSGLNNFIPDANLRLKMYGIFQLNASVKFAKYMPLETQSKNILQEVVVSLEQVDAATQQPLIHANRMA